MKLLSEQKIAAQPTSSETYQTISSVALSEPRLPMIERRLRELLKVIQLESGGVPVNPDGLRLRNPANWTGPSPPIYSELWHISTACNMRCPFCYEEGDPNDGSKINDGGGMATLNEIETRLKYRSSSNQTALFRPLTNINEIFCNPNAIEILERLREESPDEVLTFVTNGCYLTEDMVARLAKLKPLYFNFSVNSLDAHIRKKVLKDLNPNVAIEAIELLKKYEIPFLGSLVCWPTIPWSDIENTVRTLDKNGCVMIRYSLSAYSKHLKGLKHRQFDRKEFWAKGVELAQRLASELATPVKIEPYHFADPTNDANVVGTIVGSPAAHAGLRPGDKIVAANGVPIKSANHALTAVASAESKRTSLELEIVRNSEQTLKVLLEERDGEEGYPYSAVSAFPGFQFGLLLVENLKYSHIKQVAEVIRTHNSRSTLLLSSELMKPIVQSMIHETNPFGSCEVFVEVPENRFFGGTVVLGDLLVVDDFVYFINDYIENHQEAIDLVIIPGSPFSLSGWMRDLAGTPATEIERRTGKQVVFLDFKPLNG